MKSLKRNFVHEKVMKWWWNSRLCLGFWFLEGPRAYKNKTCSTKKPITMLQVVSFHIWLFFFPSISAWKTSHVWAYQHKLKCKIKEVKSTPAHLTLQKNKLYIYTCKYIYTHLIKIIIIYFNHLIKVLNTLIWESQLSQFFFFWESQ